MSRRGVGARADVSRRVGFGAVGERGSVSAELAVALPAVVLVLALGTASLGAGARLVRLQDAAADAARLVSRGEPDRIGAVVAAAAADAHASIDDRGDLVCVTVAAPPGIPVGLPPLTATSCALAGGQ